MIDKTKVGASSGSTSVYNSGSSFANKNFVNAYLIYNIPDLVIENCTFKGLSYILNTGGTITFLGTNKGGYVICNKSIPEETLIGLGDVPEENFPPAY